MGILNEVVWDASLGEMLLIPAFHKKAALILEVVDVHNEQIFERSSRYKSLHFQRAS